MRGGLEFGIFALTTLDCDISLKQLIFCQNLKSDDFLSLYVGLKIINLADNSRLRFVERNILGDQLITRIKITCFLIIFS